MAKKRSSHHKNMKKPSLFNKLVYSKQRNVVLFIVGFGVIGGLLLLSTQAAGPSADIEPETSASIASPATTGTDSSASGSGYVQFREASVQPTTPSRGPNGTHWPPNTPAYATPKTKSVSSLDELNNALATAQSGDVIEVAPGTYSTTATNGYEITNGNTGWTQNVLIRPPLGQRQSVVVNSSFIIKGASHITVAGFKFNSSNIRLGWSQAATYTTRSFIARSIVDKNTAFWVHKTTDSGIYEVIAPETKVGTDRMQITCGSTNFTLSGVYLKGASESHADDHNDTVQVYNAGGSCAPPNQPAVNNIQFIDSVIFPSGNTAALNVGFGKIVLRNVWVSDCRSDVAPGEYSNSYTNNGCNFSTGRALLARSNPDLIEIYDTDIYGRIDNSNGSTINSPIKILSNSRVLRVLDGITNNVNSQINPSLVMPPPALPDLDTIWPQ